MTVWRRWLRHPHGTEESAAALAAATRIDDEVARLGDQLAEIQRRNHFSAMVKIAIARTAREE